MHLLAAVCLAGGFATFFMRCHRAVAALPDQMKVCGFAPGKLQPKAKLSMNWPITTSSSLFVQTSCSSARVANSSVSARKIVFSKVYTLAMDRIINIQQHGAEKPLRISADKVEVVQPEIGDARKSENVEGATERSARRGVQVCVRGRVVDR
jgi:hypothetical protein